MRELTNDEIIQRGQMAMDLLQNPAAQMVLNEMVAMAVKATFETEPKQFKEREDHYHMVRAVNTAIDTLKTWAALGAQALAEQTQANEQDE